MSFFCSDPPEICRLARGLGWLPAIHSKATFPSPHLSLYSHLDLFYLPTALTSPEGKPLEIWFLLRAGHLADHPMMLAE
jgi:hypothetical protein